MLAFFVSGYFYLHRTLQGTPKLTDKDRIVLADFTNTTGDPLFDGTLRQGLAVQLEQSPFLSLVSEERVQQVMPLMGQRADSRLTPELAREICERTGSTAVLDGSIASLGKQYVLGLRARNCHTGDVLDEEQVQATRKEDVLNSLNQIARKFRIRVGESLTTIKEHDTPLQEATTPSLEALKAYSAAWKVAFSIAYTAAVPDLKRAIEIDPNFAAAHAYLGRIYGDIGESVLSEESTVKAYQLRGRASDREKFFITASYDLQVTGNLEKAKQTLELWTQTYPREAGPHGLLSGTVYQCTGKYEESIEEAKKAIALDPDFTPGYANLAYSYFYLDRAGDLKHLADAENVIQRASERNLEIPDILLLRYNIASLTGDKAGMERAAAGLKASRERKTGCLTRRLLRWPVSVSCKRPWRLRGALCSWLSKQGSGKERLSFKREKQCGKPSSEMDPSQDEVRWQHLNFPTAGMWSMALRSHWRLRAILRSPRHSRTISKGLPRGHFSQIYLCAYALCAPCAK